MRLGGDTSGRGGGNVARAGLPRHAPAGCGGWGGTPHGRTPCQGQGGSGVWLPLRLARPPASAGHVAGCADRAHWRHLWKTRTGKPRPMFKRASPGAFGPSPGPSSGTHRPSEFGGSSEVLQFVLLTLETGEGPGMWPPRAPSPVSPSMLCSCGRGQPNGGSWGSGTAPRAAPDAGCNLRPNRSWESRDPRGCGGGLGLSARRPPL